MKKVLVVNLLGRVATGLLPFFFLPLYFRHMGSESYGLYALLLSVQAILGFLDFGLSSSITREFSRQTQISGRATLFATFELSHCALGVGVAVALAVGFIFFPQGGALFVQLKQLGAGLLLVACCLYLAAAWPLPFYSGALIGAELQIELNIISLLSGCMRYGIGWLILCTTDLGLPGMLLWQSVIFAVSILWMRGLLLRRAISKRGREPFKLDVLRRHASYSIKIFGVLLMGAFLSQSDKIFLSALLGLKVFGYYAIATALASAFLVAVHPITSTYFPRFVQLHDAQQASAMVRAFQACALLICTLVLAPSAVAIVQPEAVLRVWTSRGADIESAASFLPMLMLAAHGSMFMTLLQSVHTAGSRPQYIFYANVAQMAVLLIGFWLASVYQQPLVVLMTMVAVPIIGVLVLNLYLAASVPELSGTVLRQSLLFVLFVYVCAAISRQLLAHFEVTDALEVVLLSMCITVLPPAVASFALWRGGETPT